MGPKLHTVYCRRLTCKNRDCNRESAANASLANFALVQDILGLFPAFPSTRYRSLCFLSPTVPAL